MKQNKLLNASSRKVKGLIAGLALGMSGLLFAARTTPPAGVELIDLTDDLENRASITGNDNLNNSNGAMAFDIIGDVPTSTTGIDNGHRFGGNAKPVWVVYEFKTPQVVNAYRIYNQHKDGHSPEDRSPKAFHLEGSQTGADGSWEVLDSENETEKWDGLEARYFEFPNLTAYKFYRLRLVSPQGGDGYIVIQELELFSIDRNVLLVTGTPEKYGEPTPAYGIMEVKSGQVCNLSIETPVVLTEGKQIAGCVGWRASQRDVADATKWNALGSGTQNVAQFDYPGGVCTWEWQFVVSNKVEVAMAGEGHVNVPDEGWCAENGFLTLRAIPNAGFRFHTWQGDTGGLDDVTATTISVRCDRPKSLRAVFVPAQANNTLYVDPNGSDENAGFTEFDPKQTVGAAIDYLDATFGELGGTVFVRPGVYPITKEMTLTNAIAVVGTTGNPADVTIRNVKEAQEKDKDHRVFILRNASAHVSGLTIEKGASYSQGGNISIGAAGGVVSNCWIRSGMVRSWNGRGGGVYLNDANALVTHCRIEDCAFGWQAGSETDGIAAYVARGTVANSLIVGSAAEGTYQYPAAKDKSVVRVLQGSLVNCTIVNNCHTGLVAAVRSSHGDARVVNCVMAGTRTTGGASANAWSGAYASSFLNCVTDDAEPINGTCRVGTVGEMFVDYESGNYQPKLGGLLHNKGKMTDIAIPSVDLAGAPRVAGKGLDIGCYENQKTVGFKLIIR